MAMSKHRTKCCGVLRSEHDMCCPGWMMHYQVKCTRWHTACLEWACFNLWTIQRGAFLAMIICSLNLNISILQKAVWAEFSVERSVEIQWKILLQKWSPYIIDDVLAHFLCSVKVLRIKSNAHHAECTENKEMNKFLVCCYFPAFLGY